MSVQNLKLFSLPHVHRECPRAFYISSVLSVSFDSLAPARLALRANLRLLYLKGPTFSIVVNSAWGLKNSTRAAQAAEIPLGQFPAAEKPEEGAQSKKRPKRNPHAGTVPRQRDARKTRDGASDGCREESE